MDWRGGTRVIVGAGRIRPFARGVRAVVSIVGCMFFKLFKTGKAADAETPPGDSTAVAEEQGAGAHQSEPAKPEPAKPGSLAAKSEVRAVIPVTPLKRAGTALAASELRRCADAASLGFATTADLEPGSGLIGQERALKAIQFGADMKAPDFNMFVLGPPASGKSTAVRAHLAGKAVDAPTPEDWVYVNNFEDANRPRTLTASRRPRPRLRKADGRGHRRVARDVASGLRVRGLPGPPPRHRRRDTLRSRGGAGGAEPQGAGSEHRGFADADGHRHGAHARGQGREARRVRETAGGDAKGRRGPHRSLAARACKHPVQCAADRESATWAVGRTQRRAGPHRHPRRARRRPCPVRRDARHPRSPGRGRDRSRAQRRPLSRQRRGGRDRQGARRHLTRSAFPPLHDQRLGR